MSNKATFNVEDSNKIIDKLMVKFASQLHSTDLMYAASNAVVRMIADTFEDPLAVYMAKSSAYLGIEWVVECEETSKVVDTVHSVIYFLYALLSLRPTILHASAICMLRGEPKSMNIFCSLWRYIFLYCKKNPTSAVACQAMNQWLKIVLQVLPSREELFFSQSKPSNDSDESCHQAASSKDEETAKNCLLCNGALAYIFSVKFFQTGEIFRAIHLMFEHNYNGQYLHKKFPG